MSARPSVNISRPVPSFVALPRFTIVDAAVLGGLLFVLLYGIGSYGLYEPHEGHFAGVGREMFLTGDWITPQLNGAAYLNKPPLYYWLIAASFSVFGISEWAARLPQALIGWAGVVLAWFWARELWGDRAGRVAAGILGVSAGWYLFSHQLMIDDLLCVSYLASLYLLWKCITQPERPGHWIWFYAIIGLSIMAKGFVGAGFALAVLLAFSYLRKDWAALRNCRPWLGLAIVAAICLPWLILVEIRNPGYLKYVIVNEHWNRILGKRWPPDYVVSQESALKFLLMALVWLAPWSIFLPQIALFGAKNASRWSGVERKRADAIALLALGALVPILLFLPMPSRLIYYCLPALPPFAVLAAGWWVMMAAPAYSRGRKIAALSAIVFGAAIAISGLFIGDKLKHISDLAAAPQTLELIPSFALSIGAGLLACGMLIFTKKTGSAAIALCLCIGLGEAYNTAGFTAFDRVRSSKRTAEKLLPRAGPDCVWISEGSQEIGAAAGTAFYLGLDSAGRPRQVLVMKDSPNRFPPKFPGEDPSYLIDRAQLARIWESKQPALYITDFLHRNTKNDPYNLPPGEKYEVQMSDSGHRKVFVNAAARGRFGL